jgi:hypothetical protein
VKTFPPKIFDAVAAYLMNSLCIDVSVRSKIAQKKKDSQAVINAMNFLLPFTRLILRRNIRRKKLK